MTSLLGGDSAIPQPTRYQGKKIWAFYVAGDTFEVWTKEDVAALKNHGIEGTIPTVVPPQGAKWWELIALWQQNRIAKGDLTAMWITEYGWQYSAAGMTQQLQSLFIQTLQNGLLGIDPINNVPFSSYLTGLIHYWIVGATDPYTINPSNVNGPAVAMLTEMVSGH